MEASLDHTVGFHIKRKKGRKKEGKIKEGKKYIKKRGKKGGKEGEKGSYIWNMLITLSAKLMLILK